MASFHVGGHSFKHKAHTLSDPFGTAAEVAFSRGGLEVIACIHIHATIFRVAHAVSVCVLGTPAAAHAHGIQHVALAIAGAFSQPRSIADPAHVRLHAGPVVVACKHVEIASRRIRASEDRTKLRIVKHPRAVEGHGAHFICPQPQGAFRQDLKIQRSCHRSCRGDLQNHHPHGFVRKGIGCVVQHKPHRPNFRIGTKFHSTVGREERLHLRLRIVRGQLRVGCIVQTRERRRSRQPNGGVRVVLQLRKQREQRRRQPSCVPRSVLRCVERPLVDPHHQWRGAVPEHRRHPVSRRHHVDVETVGRRAFQGHCRGGFHGQTVIWCRVLRVGPSHHQHKRADRRDGLGKARKLEIGHVRIVDRNTWYVNLRKKFEKNGRACNLWNGKRKGKAGGLPFHMGCHRL